MESPKLPLYMVTDTELCEFCDPCKKLKDVEVRLALSDELDESLRNQRANLKSAVNLSHDRIIGRFPLEIASYIFQLYIDSDTPKPGRFPGRDIIFYMTNTPFQLGAVCRAWRAIVWNLPQLWKKLSISISLTGNRPIPDLARQWVENSGSCPLSICLYECDEFDLDDLDMEEEEIILEVIEVVNSVSARWNSLTARLASGFLQSICSTGDKEQPSILRDLCLVSTDEFFPMQHFIKNNPGHLPALLTICNVEPSKQGAEWANLTELDAENLTTEDCLRVLQQAPYLIDLTFELDEILLRHDADVLHHGRTVIHPGLRSLSFTEVYSNSVAKLYAMINLLTLPSLSTLMVRSADDSDPMRLIDTLISLIERSTCQLITLQIQGYGGPAEQLMRLLQITPSLKLLDITFDTHANRVNFLKHLMKAMQEDGHSIFLPSLKIFQTTLRCYSKARDSWEDLLSLDLFDTGHDGQPWKFDRPWTLTLHFRMTNLKVDYISIHTMRRILKLLDRGILLYITNIGNDLTTKSISLYEGEQLLLT